MKLLSLIEMTVSGGALILAVMLVRVLVLDKLPKRAFLVLWALAAARLLVPVGVPSALSVWTLAEEPLRQEAVEILPRESPVWMEPGPVSPAAPAGPDAQPPAEAEKLDFPVWTAVWLTGLCLCAGFYLLTYLRCRRAFREAVPVEDEAVDRYLAERPLRRQVQVRQWGRETGPMTYGILRPVILLPKNTDWSDTERLRYVLEHELVHIRRLDGLTKLVLAAAACVHWFNPLSWAMLALAGRDIELSCDEAVVRRCGLDRRSAYAMTLIDLEEQKSGLGPFASAFSRNNMEERIRSIMKIKKTSLLAVVLAVVLVCGLGTVFATSAAEKNAPPRPSVEDGSFTKAELDRLADLWFEGYGNLTIAEYQEKMWQERDNPEDMELIERYGMSRVDAVYPDSPEETKRASAFDDYMQYVYEPLTSELWQRRNFPDANTEAYWTYTLTILDRDMRVASYEAIRVRLKELLADTTSKERADAIAAGVSNDSLKGLTMWFEGKEVRGIFDEKEGVWISEHIGNGFSDGAVELYTVYTGGALTGLRPATPEEQAEYDGIRDRNTASLQNGGEEEREFLNATRADYDGILALRTADYAGQSLADFNQRLLDWGNENADAWDRINCDVIWDDYAVELTEEEKAFVSLTCRLSGTENGQKVRALYTGGEAADPGFAAKLPMLQHVEDSVTTAWCDLYYDLTYHVSDPAAVTVGERDRCVAAMEQAISDFWWATPMDELLGMTEEDIVVRFNAWAADCGTDHVSFCHVTGDHVHYECADERGYHDEVHHAEEHHSGHHS